MEEWRSVKGYEGLYEVSNLGRVRNSKGKIKTQRIDHGGYCTVALWHNYKQKHMKIHRLVAESFIENPENKRTVNHIDGNKLNNIVENLEWATHSENLKHAYKMGLNKKSEKQLRMMSDLGKRTADQNRQRKRVFVIKDGEMITFESAHAGARFVNGDASPIIKCCKGKMKKYKGYTWGYCDAY